jgi:hypothetical protein
MTTWDKIPKLRCKKLGKYWWVLGDEDAGPMGPYNSRQEAKDETAGLPSTYKWMAKVGIIKLKPKKNKRP